MNMQRQGTLAPENLPRLYNLIDPSGVLGHFDEDKSFIVDIESSWKFVDLIAQLLQTYRQDPDRENLRIALIYRPLKPRDWTSETLVFTDDTLHRLYPSPRAHRPRESRRTDSERRSTDCPGGDTDRTPQVGANELTEFQKRNREKSAYRGIELLLEYRSLLVPDTPIFCPVLFNRSTTLDQYRTNLGIDEADRQAALPVFEVLNLIGLIPLQQRKTPAICGLNDTLHRLAINKSLRRPLGPKLGACLPNWSPVVSPDNSDAHRSEAVRHSETRERERRETPPQDVTPAQPAKGDAIDAHALKQIDRFRNLDHHQLARLFRGNLRTAAVGTVLIKRGSRDNWNYYLLQGTVQFKAVDGVRFLIDGTSPTARSPLANLRPRMYSVIAVSPVVYLQIDAGFEAEVLGLKKMSG